MGHTWELRLGTRGSQLALWQANAVAARIAETGGPPCRIVVIKTSGDRLAGAELAEMGGKGLFVKEIEDALLTGTIDLAVHSSKDLPAMLPEGLTIAGVLPREDPLDAIVLPKDARKVRLKPDTAEQGRAGEDSALSVVSGFSETSSTANLTSLDDLMAALGPTPSIGTGSVRRIAQLRRLLPGARFAPVRGNVDTRLRKLDAGEHDALVLAAAGLRRLGLASRISLTLPVSVCVAAPGQGIIAIEARDRDEIVASAVGRIHDSGSGSALEAERALVAFLGGDCQTPVGALATLVEKDVLELVAAVVALDGSRVVRAQARGRPDDASAVGAEVGRQLLADGADAILADAHQS